MCLTLFCYIRCTDDDDDGDTFIVGVERPDQCIQTSSPLGGSGEEEELCCVRDYCDGVCAGEILFLPLCQRYVCVDMKVMLMKK